MIDSGQEECLAYCDAGWHGFQGHGCGGGFVWRLNVGSSQSHGESCVYQHPGFEATPDLGCHFDSLITSIPLPRPAVSGFYYSMAGLRRAFKS